MFVGNSAAGVNKLPDQMVKTASQVVDSISNQDGYAIRQGFDCFQSNYVPRNLRVDISSVGVRVVVKEGDDYGLQITDVLFGPFNFEPNSRDAVNTHDSDYALAECQNTGSIPNSYIS